jgi:hypothetical protein
MFTVLIFLNRTKTKLLFSRQMQQSLFIEHFDFACLHLDDSLFFEVFE